jgi:hypothetical protein
MLARRSEITFAVLDDPVFVTWLRFLLRAAANGRQDEVLQHRAKLHAVLARVEQRLSGREKRYVPGSTISLHQDDLDSYIEAATPPSYDFSKASQSSNGTAKHGHPLSLQSDLLGTALQTIGEAWRS